MFDLQNSRIDTMVAFEHGMFGVSGHVVSNKRQSYLAVFDENGDDIKFIQDYISNGLRIFKIRGRFR
jgi:hypothetical protein